ncbi:MAG: hypothetical protein WC320_01725 [Candidatus Paceibacterota bacterium]|jgi:hypothetical protein
MNEEIKKIFTFLLVVGCIIGIGYFGYQYYKENKEKTLKEETLKLEELQKEMIIIKELAEKYNALTDWNKNINFTIQLQDLLVNSDKPVLFIGSVDDIFKKDDQYYIRFRTGSIWTRQVYFVLQCDASKVSEIVKENERKEISGFEYLFMGIGEYVVVAKIENVTKPTLQISGYSEIESEEVEFEYEPSSTFIATGVCIDFTRIERR